MLGCEPSYSSRVLFARALVSGLCFFVSVREKTKRGLWVVTVAVNRVLGPDFRPIQTNVRPMVVR